MILREVAAAIRSGEVSPVDHVEDVLARLDGDRCNAVVRLLADEARRDARARADELAGGGWRGPLHGVAVAVKDLIDVAGVRTLCGSNVRRDLPPATEDAPVVAMLRAAGAVVVAKTHTHEFAFGSTGDVAAQGPARNPHDLTRITGGSSSGSAAAVAAGHVPLALGTDTGASVRTPAALCGVVGFMPAYGALPTGGVFPLSESCDHVGLITADTGSAALAYQAMLSGGEVPEPDARGVVVGVPTDAYWRPLDPVIADAVAATVATLAGAGATVVEVDTPGVDELPDVYGSIVCAEAYATHADDLARRRADFQPIIAQRILANAEIPAIEYVQAQRARRRIGAALRERLAGVDVLVTATTPLRATPIGQEELDGVRVGLALLSLTLPFNLARLPAVSVPVPPSDGGLPVGVHLAGVRFGERELLRVAAVVTP